MSEQLLRAIQGVQNEIAEHRAYYVKNEAQTKQALITPILKALGWSEFRSAKSHFHMEYGDASEKVDYALIQDGKPVILLEAKELNHRLGIRAIRQVFDYCFHESVHIAVLTNGSDWRFYSPLLNSIRDFEGRCFLAINVERGETNQLVEQFNNLSSRRTHRLDEFANHHWMLSTWEKKLKNDELIQPLIKPIRDSLPSEIRVPSKDLREFVKNRLSNINKQEDPQKRKLHPTPTPLKAIEIQGEIIPAKHFYQIITETANWLFRQRKLRKEDCPVRLASMSELFCLINTKPIHPPSVKYPHGRESKFFKPLENGLFIYTGHLARSRKHLVDQTRELLNQCGYDPSILKIIGHSLETPRLKSKT